MKVKKYLFVLGMLCLSAIIFQVLTFLWGYMNLVVLNRYNTAMCIIFILGAFSYRLVKDTPRNKIVYDSFMLMITIFAFFAFTTSNALDYDLLFLKKMFVYAVPSGMDNDLLFFKIIFALLMPYIIIDILRNVKKLKSIK